MMEIFGNCEIIQSHHWLRSSVKFWRNFAPLPQCKEFVILLNQNDIGLNGELVRWELDAFSWTKFSWSKIFLFNFKIWWILAFILSIFLCTYATMDIWKTWNDNPVVVTINDKLTSIASIPFPAVTICPTKKFSLNESTALFYRYYIILIRLTKVILINFLRILHEWSEWFNVFFNTVEHEINSFLFLSKA